MLEWLTAVISPILGAGTGSLINRLLQKKPRFPKTKEPPPGSLAALNEKMEEMETWREEIQDILENQEKSIRRLRRDVRITRYILDVFLVLLLVAAGVLWWIHNRPALP